MANNVAEGKNAKPSIMTRLKNRGAKIKRFFTNMFHEMKKVSWPTKKEMVNYSVVVFLFIILMTIVIGAFDFAANWLVKLIVSL